MKHLKFGALSIVALFAIIVSVAAKTGTFKGTVAEPRTFDCKAGTSIPTGCFATVTYDELQSNCPLTDGTACCYTVTTCSTDNTKQQVATAFYKR